MPVFDVKGWLQQVKAANPDLIPPETEKEVESGFMRQDEFNRRLETEVKPAKQKYETVYQENLKWRAEKERRLRLLEDLENRGIDPEDFVNNNGNVRGTSSDDSAALVEALRRQEAKIEELQNTTRQIGLGAVELTTFMTSAAEDFREKYGKRFDPKDFQKFYEEKYRSGEVTNLRDGFRMYTEPHEAERTEKERATWQEQERAKIREEERQTLFSQRGELPIDFQPAGSSFFAHQREASQAGDNAAPKRLTRDEKVRLFSESYAKHAAKES